MKLSRIAISAMLAALVSSSAFAGSYGDSSTVVGAGGYTFDHIALPSDGIDFTDSLTFTLGAGSGVSSTLTATFNDWSRLYPNDGYFPLSLPSVSFTLNGVTKTVSAIALNAASTGTALASASFGDLVAGTTYTLNVAGMGVGDNAGTGSFYLGDSYKVTVTPVPEPETYAMFLAGIGLLGLIARKRSA